jgi:hypothetical protein
VRLTRGWVFNTGMEQRDNWARPSVNDLDLSLRSSMLRCPCLTYERLPTSPLRDGRNGEEGVGCRFVGSLD